MPERYSRRLAGLGVEYSGLEDPKATTTHDQATASSAQTEVYPADLTDLPQDADDTTEGPPPSPDRKRPSDESPTISPPTEGPLQNDPYYPKRRPRSLIPIGTNWSDFNPPRSPLPRQVLLRLPQSSSLKKVQRRARALLTMNYGR
ncbi:hypothetical protein AeMF1_000097 [Aphanomyces euteiches]|nr:hypothetical protein AeMF1_000097 [Aphanomyces euteiches]